MTLSDELRKLAYAAGYVTAIPGLQQPESEEALSGLAKYLPVVGTLVGALLAAFNHYTGTIINSELLIAFLTIGFWLVITRAIHFDGLMDAADGLLSHRSIDKMLEIMKDSRVGNFGAICGIVVLLAKIISLSSIDPQIQLVLLLLIPVWARWAELFAIAWFPYAKDEGMGKIWHDTCKIEDLFVGLTVPIALTIGLCIYYHTFLYLIAALVTAASGMLFAWLVNKMLNGHTGDTYGATVEISEASALVLMSLLSTIL